MLFNMIAFGAQRSWDSSNKCIYIRACMCMHMLVKIVVSRLRIRPNLTLEYWGESRPAEHPYGFQLQVDLVQCQPGVWDHLWCVILCNQCLWRGPTVHVKASMGAEETRRGFGKRELWFQTLFCGCEALGSHIIFLSPKFIVSQMEIIIFPLQDLVGIRYDVIYCASHIGMLCDCEPGRWWWWWRRWQWLHSSLILHFQFSSN